MKAAYLNKSQSISIEEIAKPEPNQSEVRVKLTKVGICGSDVHLFQGHRKMNYPHIIGHEGIGFVEFLGQGVSSLKIGDRVAIEPNIPCKDCRFCLSGRGNICENKRVIGLLEPGCFAEYVVLPARACHIIPKEISDENAVLIEPMAVALHALFLSKSKPGDAIAILGLGAIGLLLCHLATKLGYEVLVTDIERVKMDIALKMGALPIEAKGSLEEQKEILSAEWTSGKANTVFECVGTDFTVSLSAAAAPRGSELILLGLSEKQANFQPLKIVREGIYIIPSIIYEPTMDFQRVIKLLKNKTINPAFLISKNVVLAQLQEVLESCALGQETKAILNFYKS
jgi:L-iditol 2-dehydrogenase